MLRRKSTQFNVTPPACAPKRYSAQARPPLTLPAAAARAALAEEARGGKRKETDSLKGIESVLCPPFTLSRRITSPIPGDRGNFFKGQGRPDTQSSRMDVARGREERPTG
jgi:hypothetical protein